MLSLVVSIFCSGLVDAVDADFDVEVDVEVELDVKVNVFGEGDAGTCS